MTKLPGKREKPKTAAEIQHEAGMEELKATSAELGPLYIEIRGGFQAVAKAAGSRMKNEEIRQA